jgi:hypothetical protein
LRQIKKRYSGSASTFEKHTLDLEKISDRVAYLESRWEHFDSGRQVKKTSSRGAGRHEERESSRPARVSIDNLVNDYNRFLARPELFEERWETEIWLLDNYDERNLDSRSAPKFAFSPKPPRDRFFYLVVPEGEHGFLLPGQRFYAKLSSLTAWEMSYKPWLEGIFEVKAGSRYQLHEPAEVDPGGKVVRPGRLELPIPEARRPAPEEPDFAGRRPRSGRWSVTDRPASSETEELVRTGNLGRGREED